MNREERLRNVKLMHNTMVDMNNEDAYYTWIYIMPDEPRQEDFEWFADSEKEYDELYQVFIGLLNRYAKDGLYRPSDDVVAFVEELGIPIEIIN